MGIVKRDMCLIAVSAVAMGLFAPLMANARPAECRIEVDQKEVFSGTCDFAPHNDGTGSFVLTAPNGYFAYVNIFDTPGEAQGYWNGWQKGSKAHDNLGTLIRETKDRACWSNDDARVCAW